METEIKLPANGQVSISKKGENIEITIGADGMMVTAHCDIETARELFDALDVLLEADS